MQNLSDSQLVAEYLAGDERSLEVLFARYIKPIYSFVYRYVNNARDAEDIAQDVFVKTWRNLKKFNPRRSRFATLRSRQQKSLAPRRTNEVSSGARFKTWIFSIAKNASLDYLRKKKAIPFSEFEKEDGENVIIETLADPSPLPQELLEKADMAQMINTATEKLSTQYRMVLFLRYNGHFNFREIAESLGEPLHTVKSRHRRALVKIRELLTDT